MNALKSLASQTQVGPNGFYPPLIRLQQIAPHPMRRKTMLGIVGLVLFLLIWAMLGRLDIVAVADGKLVPSSYLKIVQPSEAGIVKSILVREGDAVKAGQVLMRMDTQVTETEMKALSTEHSRKRLQLGRIDAELGGTAFAPMKDLGAKHVGSGHLGIGGDSGVEVALVREAQAQFLANKEALAAMLAEEHSRLLKAQQELAAAKQLKSKLEAVLPHFKDQEKAYDKLLTDGFVGTLMGSDKRRERIEKEQELATQEHLIASAQASIEQSQKKRQQIQADYVRNLHAERQQAQTQLESITKELDQQKHRHQLMELRATQDGVVKNLATHTAGTVVQPGTVLASLVPSEEHLKAEVWVSNEDIGFVRVGQNVKLKFAAYPFQKYGMGEGVVEFVTADAQSQEEAQDAGLNGTGTPPLRYKALVSVKSQALATEGIRFPLSAGMQTTAEVLLGRRTVMEYLLSPVQKAWHEAARER